MSIVDGNGPMPRLDVLAGSPLPGRDSYPLFHRTVHGTLDDIIGHSFALISIGVDAGAVLSHADQAFLARLGAVIVRIVPPDGDGADGYCDLDFGYTAFLAGHKRQAALVRPDGTIQGSVDDVADLPDLVASLRAVIAPG
jgi:hypothetical protein